MAKPLPCETITDKGACGHDLEWHDPCSLCAKDGRKKPCRNYSDKATNPKQSKRRPRER